MGDKSFKNSFVLRTLKILRREEILKLSEILRSKLSQFYGEEERGPDETKSEDNLKSEFQKTQGLNDSNLLHMASFKEQEQSKPSHEKTGPESESELFLMQLKILRHNEDLNHKLIAVSEYKKFSDLFQINRRRKSGSEAQTKNNFASTDGILINKKQA